MAGYYLLYIFTMLCYGSSGILAGFTSLSSFELISLRCLLGGAVVLAVLLLKRQRLTFYKDRKAAFYLISGGFGMGIAGVFLFEAYSRIGISVSALIMYSAPVLVMLLSPVIFKEKLTFRKIAAFAVVVAGVVLINGKSADVGMDSFGFLCALCAAAVAAFCTISAKKASHIGGLECAAVQLISAFIPAYAVTLFFNGPVIRIAPGDVLPVLVISLLNTGLGSFMSFTAMNKLPAQSVSVLGYLESFFSIVLSAVFLKETMAPVQIAGAVLIVGGSVFAEAKSR